MNDKIILIDSDEAATYMTNIKGWVSSRGHYYGDDERLARYDGCTHKYCDRCGSVINKNGMTICNSCWHEKKVKRYNDMPKKDWDEETPLFSEAMDEYFFDVNDLSDAIEENGNDLRLIICEPTYFKSIDFDYFADSLPDEESDLPEELNNAIIEINKVIKTLGPASWTPGKFAAIVKL